MTNRRGPRFVLFLILAVSMLAPYGSPHSLRTGPVGPESHLFNSDSALEAAMNSRAPVTAIIQLDEDPVVVHELKMARGSLLNKRLLLSDEAKTYEARLAAAQDALQGLAAGLVHIRVATNLRKVANAISVEVAGIDLPLLASLPHVRKIELTRTYRATLDKSVALIGAPNAWESVGGQSMAGQGIKIAVVDSGIDITNPLFSDPSLTMPAGFPRGDPAFVNTKVIVAKAFLPDSSATPNDENGHGTNVAGIAAGSMNTPTPLGPISGVAPKAYIGNYRVLDRLSAGRNDLIARGLEEALSDGFDIANMSLGGDPGTGLTFLDQAVENAVAAGLTVVVSAGNSGASGAMSITSPGTAPSAITVTATTNSHSIGPAVSVADPLSTPGAPTGIRATVGRGSLLSVSDLQTAAGYVDVSAIDGQNLGCGSLPQNSLAGKVALIERGSCSFPTKRREAFAARPSSPRPSDWAYAVSACSRPNPPAA